MTSIDIPVSAYCTLYANTATTNYSTYDTLYVGESRTQSGAIYRACVVPDFSGIAAGQTFSSAILKITPIADLTDNARTLYVHRVLQSLVTGQATWNVFSTGNNWGTAGCSSSSDDYDGAVVMGSGAVSATPTLNTAIEITLDHAELQKLYDGTYTNNGVVLFVDTQLNDCTGYATQLHATAAYRPKITIVYGGSSFIPKVTWF